jgi:hypothetical protein
MLFGKLVFGAMGSLRRRRCRHCHRKKSPRAESWRGLCWTCYYTPAIRQLYPARKNQFSEEAMFQPPRASGDCPLPLQPTTALPASAEKVAVLEERARMGCQLWHPRDAQRDDDRRSEVFRG